jgi:hypothetical protein
VLRFESNVCNNPRSEIITSVRVTKNEVKVRNEKVVYKEKIRKMGLENACDDTVRIR